MDPEHLREDLKAEVMLILLEKDERELQDIHRTKGLKFYAVRIILNLIQSKTSRFYKMYRQYSLQIAENNRAIGIQDFNDNDLPIAAGKALHRHYRKTYGQPVEDIKTRQEIEKLQERAYAIIYDPIEDVVQGLAWYERQIVKLYIELGSYRRIEKATNISWESCYCTVQKAFEKLRHALNTA